MLLESGPSTLVRGDRNYFFVLTVICVGLVVWFMYDWRVAWPQKNHDRGLIALRDEYGRPQEEIEKFLALETPTKAVAESAQARMLVEKTPALEKLNTLLGKPAFETTAQGVSYAYYVSKYGVLAAEFRGDRVVASNMAWKTWYKTKEEIEAQFYWGLIPLVFGVYFLFRFLKAVSLKVRITEDGMQYGGLRIPFNAMKALREYNPKGWIDLYYSVGDQERKLRIDNLKVAKFEEIVRLLCEKKGFKDPLQASEEPKQE